MKKLSEFTWIYEEVDIIIYNSFLSYIFIVTIILRINSKNFSIFLFLFIWNFIDQFIILTFKCKYFIVFFNIIIIISSHFLFSRNISKMWFSICKYSCLNNGYTKYLKTYCNLNWNDLKILIIILLNGSILRIIKRIK